MNTDCLEARARLMDAARSRAAQLREQAIADFWDDAGAAARRALRASRRFAASLARHAALRTRLGA